jgi:hypothetical protein
MHDVFGRAITRRHRGLWVFLALGRNEALRGMIALEELRSRAVFRPMKFAIPRANLARRIEAGEQAATAKFRVECPALRSWNYPEVGVRDTRH